MVPQREPRLAQISLVPLSTGRALAVLVGEDGQVENRVLDLDGAVAPGALQEASNYISARLPGARWPRRPRRCGARSPRARAQLDEASRDLVEARPRRLERGCRQAPGADRARRRPTCSTRTPLSDIERVRRCSTTSKTSNRSPQLLDSAREAEATRIFIGSGEPAVRAFGLVGDRLALSRPRGQGGRRAGRDRADAVELRARRPHGGLHRPFPGQVDLVNRDMMNDNEQAAATRRLTKELEGVPEEFLLGRATMAKARASTSRTELAQLRDDLEAAKQEMLYAKAETQNVRRRLEKDIQDARAYAATGFARDILSVADNLARAIDAIPEDLREDEQVQGLVAGHRGHPARAGQGVRPARHHPHRRHGPAARSQPASGDDGNSHRRCRTRHGRAGNAGGLHDQGPPAAPGMVGVAKKPE